MKYNKKHYIFIAMLLISLFFQSHLFAGVDSDDRMVIQYSYKPLLGIKIPVKIVFLDLKYNLVVIHALYKQGKHSTLLEFFKLCSGSGSADKIYIKYLSFYKKIHEKHSREGLNKFNKEFIKDLKLSIKMLKNAVFYFNEEIPLAMPTREKLSKLYGKLINPEIEETYKKIKLTNKKLQLLHLNFGFSTRDTSKEEIDGYGGIRFSYYFLNALSNFNIGIITGVSYLNTPFDASLYSLGEPIESRKYFSLEAMISFLYHAYRFHCFFISFGVSANFRLSGGDTASYNFSGDIVEFEFKKIFPSAAVEIGYLFILKNLTFTAFVVLRFQQYFNNVKKFGNSDEVEIKHFGFGLRCGFGFAL